MADAKRIVVVGGGIAGLAAARAAVLRGRETGRPVSVTVLEGSGRFGGNMLTENMGGFLLDAGPDSWVVSKPHATALARTLGLGGSLIETKAENRRYYVAWGDKLHPVPEGLVLGVPTRLRPLATTTLFSWSGKARMAL
jgi:oxygen-dependent protoporphyrinogen oxidase